MACAVIKCHWFNTVSFAKRNTTVADVRRTMMILRLDAIQRRMLDLAEVYGWSAIRLGGEMLAANTRFNDPQPGVSR